MLFKILRQKYPNTALLVTNLDIFLFQSILSLDKLEGGDFTYDNIVSNLGTFVESADFRYNNVVFKFQPKTTQMRCFSSKILNTAFLSAKLGVFVFPQKFFNYTKSGVLISKVTILFSNYNPKITKLGIFGLKFRHFHFFMKCSK